MKSLVSNFKSLPFAALQLVSFILSFYLSVVFIVVLLMYEALKGQPSPKLKEESEYIIQKINDLPFTFFPAPKKEVDLSGELS